MPLAHRIIPTMLMTRGGAMIKRQRFDDSFLRSTGNIMQAFRIHQLRGVDECVIFDITATRENREPQYDLISKLAEKTFFPLTVGGGVSSLSDIDRLLRSGADKVAIGTNVTLIEEASDRFGNQAIVGVLDYSLYEDEMSVVIHALMLEGWGAGEIIMQCIERDGTMEGYPHGWIKSVASTVSVPVVASGGCSGYEDMALALEAGADAVACGALLQFTDATPAAAANYLHEKGWEVRHECYNAYG
jgi:cyclase